MALLQLSFKSKYVGTQVEVNVVLPVAYGRELWQKDREIHDIRKPFKTLYLFHGLSDNHSNWLRYTGIERYAEEKGIAVVMPAADTSFYANQAYGHRYFTYISEELPAFLQSILPLSKKREDNFVAGLSMGGYGAFKLALSKPEQYAAAASFSGAVDIVAVGNNGDADHETMLAQNFSEPRKLKNTHDDLFFLIENLKTRKRVIPKLFQACGTEDFLYDMNVLFKQFAKAKGVDLTYEEGPGGHTWDYWDIYIRRYLDWLDAEGMLDEEEAE